MVMEVGCGACESCRQCRDRCCGDGARSVDVRDNRDVADVVVGLYGSSCVWCAVLCCSGGGDGEVCVSRTSNGG